jgi:hypothetical protein
MNGKDMEGSGPGLVEVQTICVQGLRRNRKNIKLR